MVLVLLAVKTVQNLLVGRCGKLQEHRRGVKHGTAYALWARLLMVMVCRVMKNAMLLAVPASAYKHHKWKPWSHDCSHNRILLTEDVEVQTNGKLLLPLATLRYPREKGSTVFNYFRWSRQEHAERLTLFCLNSIRAGWPKESTGVRVLTFQWHGVFESH
jgi:hypothetical protein